MSALRRRAAARLARLDRHRAGHWVVLRTLAPMIRRRFDPASAGGLEATLELLIHDPLGRRPARFELGIAPAAARCGRAQRTLPAPARRSAPTT